MKVLLLLGLGISLTMAAPLPREAVMESLQKAISAKPETPVAPPVELNPAVESLRSLVTAKPDPQLILLLIQYQIAYPNPENDFVARTLGQLFYDQTAAVTSVYHSLKPEECIRIFPYLKFGWSKAIEEKNTSLPQVREKQKEFDRIERGLINLRSYQADPS